MLAPNHKNIALWLQNKFISLGYTNTVLDSFIMVTNLPSGPVNDTTMQYNVIATYTGSVTPDNVYIVGGHYDDITYVDPMNLAPGADDDASGVAAAFEIARVMKKIGYTPESTIKFAAFDGEEAMIDYSNEYGSHHYVADAINNNENIGFFITNDMIANNTDSTNWKLIIRNHTTSGFSVQLADDICQNYTCLTPVNYMQPMTQGADDIPFSQAGIPALFMFENNTSPNYHQESDTLGNCNMAYCAEVTKVSAGMLIKASATPLNIKNYFIINPGDGHTLQPSWKANDENDLAGYKVYIGRSPGIYDSVLVTTDTSYIFNNLLTDTLYYIGVRAFNNKGIESSIVEKSDAPGLVTLSQGILIVKDSQGGILNPSETQVNTFYNQICDGFVYSQYNATTTNKISLNTIGKYSSILWYMNNFNWSSSILNKYTDILRNYLNLGGHILFTLFKPSKIIENNTVYPSEFKKGSFIYDCANIDSVNNRAGTRFCGAIPASADVDSMNVDSSKVTVIYNLLNVEVFSPTQNGNVLYLYDTRYDSTSAQGCSKNKPVGIENKGAVKNVVTLSFPLYYMKTNQAQDFIYHVMHDKFNENYTNINEIQYDNNSDITVYPDPAQDKITITSYGELQKQTLVSIFNIQGQQMMQAPFNNQSAIELDVSALAKGIYIVKVQCENAVINKKLIIQ
jgi:hypothetical protein